MIGTTGVGVCGPYAAPVRSNWEKQAAARAILPNGLRIKKIKPKSKGCHLTGPVAAHLQGQWLQPPGLFAQENRNFVTAITALWRNQPYS
jgi:hypothetical protein